MEIVFTFAGQGSQFYGMGRRLYEDNVSFKHYLDTVDEAAFQKTGIHIKEIMMDEAKRSAAPFDNLLESSLSIFAFEYSALGMMTDAGIKPDAVIGCSLGELAAQSAAGILSIDEAISLITAQTGIFNSDDSHESCMMAVGGDYADGIDNQRYPDTEIVYVSHSKQYVVSGSSSDILKMQKDFSEKGCIFIALPVAFPFHTKLMEGIKDSYKDMLLKVALGKRTPAIKYYSCVNANEIKTIDDDYRWNVLRQKIAWKECIERIDKSNTLFVDLSADGELAMSLRYLKGDNENIYKVSTSFNTKIDIESIIKEISDKGGKRLKAYVFPGQGSQVKGMGADLFDEFPEYVEIADKVLGYSIKDLCLNNPENKLNNTQYTQPALFTVCTLSYLKKMKDGEAVPDYMAGHSLGEYSALFAAGAIDFETGIRLVKARAELMGQAKGGAMAAIAGLSRNEIETVLNNNNFSGIDIANLNTPDQTVISGPKDDIVAAEAVFSATEGCILYKVLNVSGAFHSRYMQSAVDEFKKYLDDCNFSEIKIPVIANITGKPYEQDKIKDTLAKQMVSSVYWTDSIRYMMARGVDTFEEIGPGHVAAGMVRKIQRMTKPEELVNYPEVMIKGETEAVTEAVTEDALVSEDTIGIDANSLGSADFIRAYNLKYAYVLGEMGKGISGVDLVNSAASHGLLAFYGSNGMSVEDVENAANRLSNNYKGETAYGFGISYDYKDVDREKKLIDIYLKYGVKVVEATEYSTVTKALVKYRLKGLSKMGDGNIAENNTILLKTRRTDTAKMFMSPAPQRVVDVLLEEGEITKEQAEMSRTIPMCRDICAMADGGGYTGLGNMFVILPAFTALRQIMMEQNGYTGSIRIGAGGGIGAPQAAAAAFLMGADFIMTGSINQCTKESDTSDAVKELLLEADVQDMGYINTFDDFDADGRIQVLKRGTLFKARADKFYHIYCNADSKPIESDVKKQIEDRYLGRTFEEVFEELKASGKLTSEEANQALCNSKIMLRNAAEWYLDKSVEWAKKDDKSHQADYMIMCGSAMGAFNMWAKGTELEQYENRTVGNVADAIMKNAMAFINENYYLNNSNK